MSLAAGQIRTTPQRGLVVLGWVVFLGSLLLPAIRIRVPEALDMQLNFDETYSGWQAATVAMRAVREVSADHDCFLPCLAGLGNLGLMLSPLCMLSRGRLPKHALCILLLVAVISGLIVVWQFGFEALRVGFFAWVAAYLLVIAGLESRGGVRAGLPAARPAA